MIGREEDLYTKEDTDRFVQRIIALKDSPEILDDEREYFYQRYRDNYTLETHLNRHRELYLSILDKEA